METRTGVSGGPPLAPPAQSRHVYEAIEFLATRRERVPFEFS
jgi:hypothetical protein